MIEKWMPGKKENNVPKTQIKNSNDTNNKFLSKIISIAGEIFAYPDGMKYWYEPAITESSKIIEEYHIDAIISSSFPITAHLIGQELKNKYNIPWIADLRDLWNMNPYINHTFIRNYFEKKLEIKTLKDADALTTTTELAKEKLLTLHPQQKIIPILNGYEADEIKTLPEKLENKKLTITYAGSLYSGKRNPEILFKAINELIEDGKIKSDKISLNFYGDKGNLEYLKNKYNLNSVVHINGFIPHNEVLLKQNQSDILLLISWNNPKEEIFIPGKVYEYMALKRPIISIGYKKGSLKDLIDKTGIGIHTSDIDILKEGIMKYYEEFILNGKLEFKAKKDIEEYSINNMASEFSKLLNNISNIEE